MVPGPRGSFPPASALSLLLLASCGESPTGTRQVGAPALISEWGRYAPNEFIDVPGDIFLSREDDRLYIVREGPVLPSILVIDRAVGSSYEWTPIDEGVRQYPTAIDGDRSGERQFVLFGHQRAVAMFRWHQLEARWEVPVVPGDPGDLVDIAFDPVSSTVGVADASGNRLHVYSVHGVAQVDPVPLAQPGQFDVRRLRLAALPRGGYAVSIDAEHGDGVLRYGADGVLLDRYLASIDDPRGLIVGEDRNLYVLGDAPTIHRYDADGRFLGHVLDLDEPRPPYLGAFDVTASGGVILGDRSYPAYDEFDGRGKRSGSRILDAAPPDLVLEPTDFAIAPDRRIFSVDSRLRRVSVSRAGVGFERTWGEPGTTDRPLVHPAAIAVGGNDFVFVADTGLDEFRVYATSGELLAVEPGLDEPRLAADARWLYATDGGRLLRRPVHPRSSAWQLLPRPSDGSDLRGVVGMDVAPDGTLYVLDGVARTVRRFDADGRLLTGFGLGSPADPIHPVDLAVDVEGRTYIVGSPAIHAVYDAEGGLIRRWEDSRPGRLIDVAEDGRILLAGPGSSFRRLAPIDGLPPVDRP